MDLLEHIFARSIPEPNTGCWLWEGSDDGHKGYGRIQVRGLWTRAPHRVVCRAVHGDPASFDMQVDHRCNQPACVNPDHLRWMTGADNTRRITLEGRHHNSSKTHCPKGHPYTPENVRLRGTSRHCRACYRAMDRERQRERRRLQREVAGAIHA